MNDQQRAAMQMWLEALDLAQALLEQSYHHPKILSAYKTMREALAQQQEPVLITRIAVPESNVRVAQPQESDVEHYRAIKKRNAEVVALETAQPPKVNEFGEELCEDEGCPHHGTVHYCRSTKQPQGEWVDLTYDELATAIRSVTDHQEKYVFWACFAAIAAFKEKNK